jgi:hypothetical protein
MAWDFQQRLGIITTTLLRAAPQLAHLCLVILAILLLFTVAMAVGIGPYLAAAAGFGASLEDMFMGILGGSGVDLNTLFPEGLAQSSVQVFNAGLLYFVREFLFWMVLVNFFMAVLGSVFMEVKRRAGSKPGGSIAADLQRYVWPEWRSSAALGGARLKQAVSRAVRRGKGGQQQQLAAYHTRSMAGEEQQQRMAMLMQQRGQLATATLSASRLLPWLCKAAATSSGSSSSMAGTLEDVLNSQQQQRQLQIGRIVSSQLAVGVPVRMPPATQQQQQQQRLLAAAGSQQCALDLEALQELLLQLLEQGSGKGKAGRSKHLAQAAQLLGTVEAGRRWLRQQHAALEVAGGGSSGAPGAAAVLQQWPAGAVAAVADGADVAAVAGAMVVAAALLQHLGVQVAGEAVQQAHELLWACRMDPISSSSSGAPAAGGGALSAKQRLREAAAAAAAVALSRLQEEVVMAGQLQQAVWNAVGAMKRWSGAVGKWNLRTTADTNTWLQQNAESLRLLHQQRQEQQGLPTSSTAAAAGSGGAHEPREDPHLQAGEGEAPATSQQSTAATSSSTSSGAVTQQAAAGGRLRHSAEELGDAEFGWAPVRVPLDVTLLLVDVPEAAALTTAQLVEALAQQPQQAATGGGGSATSGAWASPPSAAQLGPGTGGRAGTAPGASGDAVASLSIHRSPARRLQPLLVPGSSPAASAAMSPVTLHLTPGAGGSRLSGGAGAVRGGPHLDSPHDMPPAIE